MSPPDGPPHEMVDSTPISSEQGALTASGELKFNLLWTYLCYCIDFE